jgi:hypothetical protein
MDPILAVKMAREARETPDFGTKILNLWQLRLVDPRSYKRTKARRSEVKV